MKVLLEDKNKVVEIPDGLSPEKTEQAVYSFYEPKELFGATTFLEREGYRARKGRAVVDDGKLWYDLMEKGGIISDTERKSNETMAEFSEENEFKYSAQNWPERFVGAATELTPYMFDSAIQGVIYGETLGMALAGAAYFGGPLPVLPAYAGGRAVGQAWGTWMNAAKVEGGGVYKSLIEDGIDPGTAKNYAIPAGYLIGAIELFQLERLVPGFGREGIKKLVMTSLKKGGTKTLTVLGKNSAKFAGNLTATTVVETTQETVQEIIALTAEIGAGIYEGMAEDGKYTGPDMDEVRERMQETIVSSLFGFPLLGLPRAIHNITLLHSKEKFTERVMTRRAQEAMDQELSEQVEAASKHEKFEEFHASLGEDVTDQTAGEYGFDNRQTLEEAIWNASRDVRNADEIIKKTVEDEEIENIAGADEMLGVPVLEDPSAVLEAEAQDISKKIEALEKIGKRIPKSLIKRQEILESLYNKKYTLEEIAMGALNIVKGTESIKDFEKSAKNLKKIIARMTGFEKPPKTVSEMEALRASLKAQARIAAQVERGTKKELKALKQGIADTVKHIVPPEGQKEFLTMIAAAESGRDLVKIMEKIEEKADRFLKSRMIHSIKRQIQRIEASKSISIDYVQKIKDLIEKFDSKGRSKETLRQLEETRAYIDREARNGRNVHMPSAVLDALKILEKKPLSELSLVEMEDIHERIKAIAALGKTKLRSLQAVEKMRKAVDLKALQHDSKPIRSKEIKEGTTITGKLSPLDKFLNTVKAAVNFMQEKDLVISPMDVIFDLLDGGKRYLGANFRIFKKRIDNAYGNFLDARDKIYKEIDKEIDRLNLNQDNMERIGLYAAAMQEGGIEKLLTFFTQEQIDSVTLTPAEMEFYNFLRTELDELRPQIEKVMREVYNEPLAKVANYFPFMTDFEAMTDADIRDRFGDKVITYSQTLRKNVERGFTKKRIGGKYRLKINAAEVFTKHINNALYLIHVGPETKYLGELAGTAEYGEIAGDVGQETVRQWIDLLARNGGVQGRIKMLDALRNYTGLLSLGFKLSSALIQITSLMDGAALVGPRVFQGFSMILTDSNWRQFIFNYMPEIRDRIADDPAFVDFAGKNWKKLANIAYAPLKTIDKLAASGVALGAYLQYAAENDIVVDYNTPDLEGVQFAEKMVRRTQSSWQFKDLPLAISKGRLAGNVSLDKLILQFQSFMLNRWSMIRHDLWRAGIWEKNPKQAVSIALWLTAANFAELGIRKFSREIMAQLMGKEIPEDDEDKEFYRNLGEVLQNVPFLGSVYFALLYDDLPVPSISMSARILEKLSAALKSEEDESVRKWIRFLMNTIPGARQFEPLTKEE